MTFASHEEFAAKRRTRQDSAIATLLPLVERALLRYRTNPQWWRSLLPELRDLFYAVVAEESGDSRLRDQLAWLRFVRDVRRTIVKTGEPSPHTAQTIASWLATATINAASQVAIRHDTETLVKVWVTMHDSDVRPAHREADGQRRPPGQSFEVDGVPMRYPGDPLAPIALWINCRCSLRPDLATAESAGPQTGGAVVLPSDSPALVLSDDEVHDEQAPSQETAMTTTADEQAIGPVPWHGVLAPEGKMSGDKRMFAPNALTFRDLPLPLTWQKSSSQGHDGSVVVARIEQIARVGDEVRATGHYLTTPEADEALGLVADFGRFGVSVDADDAEMELNESDESMTFTKARISSAAQVPIPAFAEAWLALGEPPAEFMPSVLVEASDASIDFGRGPGWLTNPEDTKRLHDYWTVPGEPGYEKVQWGVPGDFDRCRVEIGQEIGESSPETLRFLNQICAQWHHDATGAWPGHAPGEEVAALDGEAAPALGLAASAGWVAPSAWFANPQLTSVTPLTVTEEGRVFGHVAGWETCHIGPQYQGMCVSPPHSDTGYAYFLTGTVITDAGPIPVGSVTIDTGHAKSGPGRPALAHYDNTGSVAAYVNCGEDEHGIWIAGAVSPNATDGQVIALRGAKLSGDWRKMGRSADLEMIAALAVNTGGFPIPSTQAGYSEGVQVSLVASGIVEDAPPAIDIKSLAAAVAAEMDHRVERRERLAAASKRVMGEDDGV